MENNIILDNFGRTKRYRDWPTHILINVINGICTRKCPNCPIHSYEKKEMMKLDELEIYLKDLKEWIQDKLIKIDFTPGGEFFLHPKALEILKLTRKYFPKAYIFLASNGEVDKIEFYKEALIIIDKIILDRYDENINFIYDKRNEFNEYYIYSVINNNMTLYKNNKIEIKNKINPYTRIKGIIFLNAFENFQGYKTKTRHFNNWMGYIEKGLEYVDYKYRDTFCMNPCRQLILNSNGYVTPCCLMYNNEIILGKFPEDGSFKEIWNNEFSNALRFISRHGINNKKRSLIPWCQTCSSSEGQANAFSVFIKKEISLEKWKELLIKQKEKNYIKERNKNNLK